MNWNSKHACVLMKLTKAIELLPKVKPRKAKRLLDEIKNHFDNLEIDSLMTDCDTDDFSPYEIKNLFITKQDYEDALIKADGNWGMIEYITPAGASLLIQMYHHGCFEVVKNKKSCHDIEILEKYALSGEQLAQQYLTIVEANNEIQTQELYWKEHPEKLPEDRFTATLLNKIMWNNNKIGSQVTMEIGGILVTKEVSRYSSNSGKSHDNAVVFKWVGSNGKNREELLVDSTHQHNRRNDATRNWGLPD